MASRKSIAAVELMQSAAGHEGVDANHTSRIRIHALLDQNHSLVQQTQFADAKAGGLVTLVGLLALKGPVPVTTMSIADVLGLMTSGISALCILFCVLAVFPRYPTRGAREHLSDVDRFSWPALTAPGFDGEAYASYMQAAEVSQIVYSIARSNSAISRILLRKFQMLRIAFALSLILFALVFFRLVEMM
jgi:hypothetical protein